MIEQYYSIAVRKRNDKHDRFFLHDDFEFKEIKILNNNKYWFADPFLFEYHGVCYLFFEAYDLIEQKGKIAYSILQDDYTATKPKIIIERGYHFSFPYIFQYNNEIYIMPETCGDNNLQLFKAISFPDIWKEERVLLKDVFVSDSIFFNHESKIWLSCFEQYRMPPKGKLFFCWGKNKIHEVKDGSVSEGIVVSEGDYGIRNAGESFQMNHQVIRVGQNSTGKQYGKGLVFFTIKSMSPYQEEEIYAIDAMKMQSHLHFSGHTKCIDGTHTYNSSERYEVIDFSYRKKLPFGLRFSRFCKIRVTRFIRKIKGH